jgi:DNA-binding transcriptional MerR regulator
MSDEFDTNYTEIEVRVTHGDPGKIYDITMTATYTGTQPDLIRDYCRIGVITATKRDESDNLFFDDDAIYWLRQIRSLRTEGEVNRAALRLILDLRRQVEYLKRELRFRLEN